MKIKDSSGEWIMAHSVCLKEPWRGRAKLMQMAVLAIEECMANVGREDWPKIPLLLCVAERERAGRLEGIELDLFSEIQTMLGANFSQDSSVIPLGRVGSARALERARILVAQGNAPFVLLAATDSLLNTTTIDLLSKRGKILCTGNSNGYIPGEGASAVLFGPPTNGPELVCAGLGFALETATIDAEIPLRGDGLSKAINIALSDAGCGLQDLDFRIADISGEQYYFKEASLALSRTLRVRKEQLRLWHPAECIGESGATGALTALVVAAVANRKGYAPGPNVLWHTSSDSGERSAAVLQFRCRP